MSGGSRGDVPELLTDRLRLRGVVAGDVEPYLAMMTDVEVARWLSRGALPSRGEVWRQLATIIGHWSLRGFGPWMVEERATGLLVGRVGLWEPDGWPGVELTYALARHAWGRGYAREAGAAALRHARDVLALPEVIGLVRPDNDRSAGVARALGAVAPTRLDVGGDAVDLYRYALREPSAG